MSKLVFINGQYSAEASEVSDLPAGVIVQYAEDQKRLYISVPANTRFTLLEEYNSQLELANVYSTTIHTDIELGEGAIFHRIKIQKESEFATHQATTTIQQKKDSISDLVYYATGGRSATDKVTANLSEIGAQCRTAGFYQLTRDAQDINYDIHIHHAASQTESDMLFKCVADKKSRGEFTGRIHVLKDAQKIKAYQANHNILLSNQAEVYSRPQLEIYADDVKCKHGSTTGQLDQDALFYLRARGIEEADAKQMLLAGFAEEVLKRIPASLKGVA